MTDHNVGGGDGGGGLGGGHGSGDDDGYEQYGPYSPGLGYDPYGTTLGYTARLDDQDSPRPRVTDDDGECDTRNLNDGSGSVWNAQYSRDVPAAGSADDVTTSNGSAIEHPASTGPIVQQEQTPAVAHGHPSGQSAVHDGQTPSPVTKNPAAPPEELVSWNELFQQVAASIRQLENSNNTTLGFNSILSPGGGGGTGGTPSRSRRASFDETAVAAARYAEPLQGDITPGVSVESHPDDNNDHDSFATRGKMKSAWTTPRTASRTWKRGNTNEVSSGTPSSLASLAKDFDSVAQGDGGASLPQVWEGRK